MNWLELGQSFVPPPGVSCQRTFDSLTITIPHNRWLLGLLDLFGLALFTTVLGLSFLPVRTSDSWPLFEICWLCLAFVFLGSHAIYATIAETRIVARIADQRWNLYIYSGLQGLGWAKYVELSEIVECREAFFWCGNLAMNNTRLEISTAERSIEFGAYLKPPQREFVLDALRELQRQHREYQETVNSAGAESNTRS